MISKREVTWTLKNGNQITVQIEVLRTHVTERVINLDGDKCTVACDDVSKSQSIVAIVDGKVIDQAYIGQLRRNVGPNNQGVVAAINNKIGLSAETLALIEGAIKEATAEAEAETEIADCLTRITERRSAAKKSALEYEAHHAAVERMMNM